MGSKFSRVAAPVAAAGSFLFFVYGYQAAGAAAALALAGLLLSVRDRSRFDWWPAFLGYWIASFPVLHTTGGFHSPFLNLHLVLMFMGSAVIQSRYSAKQAILFTSANYAFWLALLGLGVPATTQSVPLPLLISMSGLYLLGIFLCILAYLQSEERFAKLAMEGSNQLAETRASLTHAAKLAEVGNLVATTAHELAQPLQVIGTTSGLLRRLVETGKTDSEMIPALTTRLQESSARMTRLLSQFREFSRKDGFTPRKLDLREAVRSVEQLTQYDLRCRKVDLEVALPEEPLWIEADSLQIQQMLFNLVNNARDACTRSDARHVRISAGKTQAGRVRVAVSNNGAPIPPDVQGKLFQAYFTTKDRGQGTGLGLTICQQLAEKNSGRILFSSGPGETVFALDFPETEKNLC